MRIYDRMVEAEDNFFQGVADTLKNSTIKERVVAGVTFVAVLSVAIGGFNYLVNNTDVSDAATSNASGQTYAATNDVNVKWDGLNP